MTSREHSVNAGGAAMRRRSGFTLVEVLVAMALILFIMTILAAAFGAATQTVSDLKAAGDLAERLRAAASAIKRDMGAGHCYDANGNLLRLNAPWDTTNPAALNSPPAMGFLRIYQIQPETTQKQGQPPGALAWNEGSDLDGLPSYYQTTTSLHYTINLHGPLRNDFLSAVVPGNSPLINPNPANPGDQPLLNPDERYQDTTNPPVYNSPAAEVALFLVPTGDVTDGGAPGGALPLYALYRRQLLTTPPSQPTFQVPVPVHYTPAAPVAVGQAANYPEVSIIPDAGETPAATMTAMSFNSLADLTMPVKRFWMDRTNPAGGYQLVPSPPAPAPTFRYATMGESEALAGVGGYQAADLLMPDVVSFDVRVLVRSYNANGTQEMGSDFEDLFDITNPNRKDPAGNPWYFTPNNQVFNGANVRVFDTWSNQSDPNNPAYNYTPWQTPGTPYTIPIYSDNKGNLIGIQAIQITLRVWDYKTKKTRQVTIVQQM